MCRLFLSLLLAAITTSATAQTELRVASWNIAWLNAEANTGMIRRSDADYRRLAKYAKRLNADIIALQEVDGSAAASRIFDPEVYEFHFTADGGVQNVGFAIRKSLQFIANADFEELQLSNGLRRGADITVDIGSQRVRLMSVHLKCCCPEKALTANDNHCRTLRKQVPPLEGWIDARASENTPFIVLGDFNRRLAARESVWRELDDADPANANLRSVLEGMTGRCWSSDAARPFIDHIVLDARASEWLVPSSQHQERYEARDRAHAKRLSDHCPVRATLRIQ